MIHAGRETLAQIASYFVDQSESEKEKVKKLIEDISSSGEIGEEKVDRLIEILSKGRQSPHFIPWNPRQPTSNTTELLDNRTSYVEMEEDLDSAQVESSSSTHDDEYAESRYFQLMDYAFKVSHSMNCSNHVLQDAPRETIEEWDHSSLSRPLKILARALDMDRNEKDPALWKVYLLLLAVRNKHKEVPKAQILFTRAKQLFPDDEQIWDMFVLYVY